MYFRRKCYLYMRKLRLVTLAFFLDRALEIAYDDEKSFEESENLSDVEFALEADEELLAAIEQEESGNLLLLVSV